MTDNSRPVSPDPIPSGPIPSGPILPNPYLSDRLAALEGVKHGFFTREGGVSGGIYGSLNGGIGSNDSPENVRENRGRMARYLGVPDDHLVSVWQYHSPDVVVVDDIRDMAQRPKADAMVTKRRGVALAIGTADCGPVLFADAAAGVVGGAHSGWKGALTGVPESTIEAMEALGADRRRIVAVLGPMISSDAYEVGPEFVARFVDAAPGNARWFAPSLKAGHSMFDLPGFIVSRLEKAGVGHAENLGVCTYANGERLYSYRRMTHLGEPDYGRQMSAITLL